MKNTITIIISILVSAFALYAADVVVYPTSTGYPYKCPLPKTGQTVSYATDDDGGLEKGIVLPVPRFTIQSNTNCVLDNLTGLIWARNASNTVAAANWGTAITNCNSLDYGGETDWRLPNIRELYSLVDFGVATAIVLPSGHPFISVRPDHYWTSTAVGATTTYKWRVYFAGGHMIPVEQTETWNVWPVRGGY